MEVSLAGTYMLRGAGSMVYVSWYVGVQMLVSLSFCMELISMGFSPHWGKSHVPCAMDIVTIK